MAKFTESEASACKIRFINKKTRANGTHFGWSAGLVDSARKHHEVFLTDTNGSEDKATVIAAIKKVMLTRDFYNPTRNKVATEVLVEVKEGENPTESLG